MARPHDPAAPMGIGAFARATGLSQKALRLYDDLGLVPPRAVDPVTGYRSYIPDQLSRARLVARLRLIGLPLARIRSLVDLPPGAAAADLTSYWRQTEADVGTRRALVADLLAELDRHHDLTEDHMTGIPTDTDTDTDTDDRTAPPRAAVRSGRGARETQEDAYRIGESLYAVADGVGAARGVARVALDALEESADDADPVVALDRGVTRAAAAVADRYADDAAAATTLTVIDLRPGRAVSAHVGDSRLHLVREGRLTRLTHDHTVVQTLIDEGRLTAEEARVDDRRVVLNRAVAAGAPYAPDLAVHATRSGDRFVLTTDGVHGRLDPADLAGLLLRPASADDVADAVAAAVEAAGADDNYVVLVVDLP